MALKPNSPQRYVKQAAIWTILAIISGVAGNFVYDLLVSAVPRVGQFLDEYAGGAAVGLLVALLGTFLIWRLQFRELSQKIDTLGKSIDLAKKSEAQLRVELLAALAREEDQNSIAASTAKLFAADDGLLRLLPNLITLGDRNKVAKQTANQYLRDTVGIFGEIGLRALILCPDRRNTTLLSPWESLNMSSDTLKNCKFYIGDDIRRRRGVAGETYKRRAMRIVHFKEVHGEWRADDDAYYSFKGEETNPPFRSFASVPILTVDSARRPTECLGVLCIDSTENDTFDNPEDRQLLLIIANRLSALLRIYQHLERFNGSNAGGTP